MPECYNMCNKELFAPAKLYQIKDNELPHNALLRLQNEVQQAMVQVDNLQSSKKSSSADIQQALNVVDSLNNAIAQLNDDLTILTNLSVEYLQPSSSRDIAEKRRAALAAHYRAMLPASSKFRHYFDTFVDCKNNANLPSCLFDRESSRTNLELTVNNLKQSRTPQPDLIASFQQGLEFQTIKSELLGDRFLQVNPKLYYATIDSDKYRKISRVAPGCKLGQSWSSCIQTAPDHNTKASIVRLFQEDAVRRSRNGVVSAPVESIRERFTAANEPSSTATVVVVVVVCLLVLAGLVYALTQRPSSTISSVPDSMM